MGSATACPRVTVLTPPAVSLLCRELNLLDRLSDSPRVVQLLDCYEDEAHVYLVTEACLGGDLQRYSEVKRSGVVKQRSRQ